jgi:hypothetical protein
MAPANEAGRTKNRRRLVGCVTAATALRAGARLKDLPLLQGACTGALCGSALLTPARACKIANLKFTQMQGLA